MSELDTIINAEYCDVERLKYLCNVEWYGAFGTILSLIKLKKWNVAIYGAGNWGYIVKYILEAKQIFPMFYIDSKKTGTIEQIPIISSFDELPNNNFFVFVAVAELSKQEQKHIISLLNEKVEDYFFMANMKNIMDIYVVNSCLLPASAYYKNRYSELQQSYQLFNDDSSKKTFEKYLLSLLRGKSEFDQHIYSTYKYFFDDEKKSLYKIPENGVWVNVGANEGDTICKALESGVSFSKIYAVEGDAAIFNQLVQNINKIPKNENIECIQQFIDENTASLDFLNGEHISLINADIEGYELSLLKDIRQVIVEQRPVLAICVYHELGDIIDIPLYIDSIVDNYVFKLRKYETCLWDLAYQPGVCETVMYAIPCELCI